MVAGKRDLGKSQFAAWLCATVSQGRTIGEDGNEGTTKPGYAVWNSKEDPESVCLSRLKAAGADLTRIWLSEEQWRLPSDAGRIRSFLEQRSREGRPADLLVLDSLQAHFRNPGSGFVDNEETMSRLVNLAKEFKVSIVLIHHFVKGKTATVESAIGGMGVLQNRAKAIHVFGEHPRSMGTGQRFLACERVGAAAKPASLAFHIDTARVTGFKKPAPFLQYDGLADVSSWDVFEASKKELNRSGKLTSAEDSATFITQWLEETGIGDGPFKARELDEAAREAGRHYSNGTFGRARELAGIIPVHKGTLRELLADKFQWLSDDDLPPRTNWARRTSQVPNGGTGTLTVVKGEPEAEQEDAS